MKKRPRFSAILLIIVPTSAYRFVVVAALFLSACIRFPSIPINPNSITLQIIDPGGIVINPDGLVSSAAAFDSDRIRIDSSGASIIYSVDKGASQFEVRSETNSSGIATSMVSYTRLELRHLREMLESAPRVRLGMLGMDTNVAGVITGRVASEGLGESRQAEIDLDCRIRSGHDHFRVRLVGTVAPGEVMLLTEGDAVWSGILRDLVGQPHLDSMAELFRIDGGSSLKGTMIWADGKMTLVGRVNLRDADLHFGREGVVLRGVSGAIPYEYTQSPFYPDLQAETVTIREAMIRGIRLNDISALASWKDHAFHLDKADFGIAGGRGRGALAIDLPRGTSSRSAYIAEASDFDAGVIFAGINPFGPDRISGGSRARVELRADGETIAQFHMTGQVDSGRIAGPLLGIFLTPLMTAVYGKEPTPAEWNFDSITMDVRYDPHYYTAKTAREKFRFPARNPMRHEYIGNFDLYGKVNPLANKYAFGMRTPFQTIGHMFIKLRMENVQLRLVHDRLKWKSETAHAERVTEH